MGLILACPSGSSGTSSASSVPTVGDFDIKGTGTFTADGTPRPVTITPKEGKTQGAIIVYYAKDGGPKGTTVPSGVGNYAVSFDVGASGEWVAVNGLYAGQVIIGDSNKTTPTIEHYTITGVGTYITQGADAPNVSITPRTGSNAPAVAASDIQYRSGSATTGPAALPNNVPGTYNVYFTVNGNTTWNTATIFAGTIIVLPGSGSGGDITIVTSPKPSDFTIVIDAVKNRPEGNEFGAETQPFNVDYQNAELPVRIKPSATAEKPYPFGDSPAVIQYWESSRNSTIDDFEITGTMIKVPTLSKKYWIKINILPWIDVDHKNAWDALELRLELNVNKRTPVASDFDITKLLQSEAGKYLTTIITVQEVGIAPKTAFSSMTLSSPLNGTIKIFYDGLESTGLTSGTAPSGKRNIPQEAGDYVVTFDVAASTGGSANQWAAATGLSGGTLKVLPLGAINPSYDSYFWYDQDKDVLKAPDELYNSNSKRYEYVVYVDKNNNLEKTVNFSLAPGPFAAEIDRWEEDGKQVTNSGYSYTFNKTALGWHWVTLVVKTPEVKVNNVVTEPGKMYSQTVYIRVQRQQQ